LLPGAHPLQPLVSCSMLQMCWQVGDRIARGRKVTASNPRLVVTASGLELVRASAHARSQDAYSSVSLCSLSLREIVALKHTGTSTLACCCTLVWVSRRQPVESRRSSTSSWPSSRPSSCACQASLGHGYHGGCTCGVQRVGGVRAALEQWVGCQCRCIGMARHQALRKDGLGVTVYSKQSWRQLMSPSGRHDHLHGAVCPACIPRHMMWGAASSGTAIGLAEWRGGRRVNSVVVQNGMHVW
jgi:hypothetical protein